MLPTDGREAVRPHSWIGKEVVPTDFDPSRSGQGLACLASAGGNAMAEDLTHTPVPLGATVAEPAASPLSPPGYELTEEIGRGGMGVVYRARDTALDRDVALKLLSERYPPDSVPAQRFLSEARITGQLQHPGIPAVHQVGTLADGRPFLAMKLIKGSTLETILKYRPVGRWRHPRRRARHLRGGLPGRRVRSRPPRHSS
jgi:serine/threonine protein kinase